MVGFLATSVTAGSPGITGGVDSDVHPENTMRQPRTAREGVRMLVVSIGLLQISIRIFQNPNGTELLCE